MAKAEKQLRVEWVEERLGRASAAVLTDYRGLSVAQLQDLRRRLASVGVEYRVVKNTLARRAAQASGRGELVPALMGPVAIAFGYDDPAAPAKVLIEYFRLNRRPEITSAWVEGRLLDQVQVRRLAELPSREALLSQLMGTLQAPLAQLMGALETPLRQLAYGLKQLAEAKQNDGAAQSG